MRQDIKYAIFNRVTFQWVTSTGQYTRLFDEAELFNNLTEVYEFLNTCEYVHETVIESDLHDVIRYKSTYVIDKKINFNFP